MKKGAIAKPRRSFDDNDQTEVRGEKIATENLKQLENDLVLLNSKIASLSSNSQASSHNVNAPSSCFVSGLRTSVEKHRDDSNTKLKLLETVIARIADLDRVVLRKTELESTSQARRSLDGHYNLSSLPTHMHIVDRLIDYHSQAKRIHVIEAESLQAQQAQPPQTDTNDMIQQLEQQYAQEINSLKTSLSDSRIEATNEKNKSASLQQELQSSQKQCQELLQRISSLESQAATFSSNQATLQQVQQQLTSVSATNKMLEEKIEIYASQEQHILTCLGLFTKCLEDEKQRNSIVQQSNMGDNFKHLLLQCSSAIEQKYKHDYTTIQAQLSATKTISPEHEKLQTQCAQQAELIQSLQQQLAMSTALTEAKIEEYESSILQLEIQLNNSNRAVQNQTDYKQQAEEWQQKYIDKEMAWTQVSMDHATVTQELIGQQQLVEILKKKIKELSSKDSNFNDTFEEVMREEMMTMKMAFEAKLKAAREAADANSRRYQQEISRMQVTGSPSSMLKSSSALGISKK